MSVPSPFQVARETSTNLSNAFRRVKDENAIENILSQAIGTGDPQVLQDSIGKILSQVSPERQGVALQYLQNAYTNVQKKQEQEKQFQREKEAGLIPGINPTAQAAIYKEGQKNKRLGEANNVFGQAPSAQGGIQSDSTPQAQISATPQAPISNSARKQQLLALTGHPDREVAERAKAELKNIETEEKLNRADLRELRKETLPLKQQIIARADLSRESIRNKTHLMDLIDRGNINDPTFAIFAESLPLNLGKRLLSEDTVEYKGALVDEFADLKNIFKGATRVKEVEIYENKLADLYLTDSQKKGILKSRINTAKIDLIREEAAAEVEEKFPNISALQFSKKVDEIAKPKIDALFNSIWDEQKSIIDQAERRKEIPLDPNDPEDLKIMIELKKEGGGTKEGAKRVAKAKGYKVVGEK